MPCGERVRLEGVNLALKNVLEQEGTVDVLKIDCEGYEWEIMECIESSLLQRISAIAIEIHGGDHGIILSKLESHGFRVKRAKILPWRKEVSLYQLEKDAQR